VKTLHEYLAEADEGEAEIEITAAFDLHAILPSIDAVLAKYGIISQAEPNGSRGLEPHPKEFPALTMAAVTKVKATVRNRPDPTNLLLDLGAELNQKQDLMKVKVGSDESCQRPSYVPSFDALLPPNDWRMAEVDGPVAGQERIRHLIDRLSMASSDAASEREKKQKAVMTHLGLQEAIQRPLRKGYYKVEIDRMGDITGTEGPFRKRPDGPLAETRRDLAEIARF
jgi:hypothetical protein